MRRPDIGGQTASSTAVRLERLRPHATLALALLLACCTPRRGAAQSLEGQWYAGAWGMCNATCGGGTQQRQLHCLARSGQVDPLRLLCGPEPDDTPLSQPCNQQPCDFFYIDLEPWSKCSDSCGVGYRSRDLNCLAGDGLPASSESLCAALLPDTSVAEPCNTAPCPEDTAYWQVGDWGECSEECGVGNTTRIVECLTPGGAPGNNCPGLKPPTFAPCLIQPCDDACSECGIHTSYCDTRGLCVCETGWHGRRCTVPLDCDSGVLDRSGVCCVSGVLDSTGECCVGRSSSGNDKDGVSPAPPVTDSMGLCCPSATERDACGVCGGSATAVDVRGVCCTGVLDAGGHCCSSGTLDACGVCNGDASNTCASTVCGDRKCEGREGVRYLVASDVCSADCPIVATSCPAAANPALGITDLVTELLPCAGNGICRRGSGGRCECNKGYSGSSCTSCEAGWELAPSGLCVPKTNVVDRDDAPLATPWSVAPSQVVDDDDLPLSTLATVGIVVGGGIMLCAAFALWAVCCLRDRATDGLQLYPVDERMTGNDYAAAASTSYNSAQYGAMNKALPLLASTTTSQPFPAGVVTVMTSNAVTYNKPGSATGGGWTGMFSVGPRTQSAGTIVTMMPPGSATEEPLPHHYHHGLGGWTNFAQPSALYGFDGTVTRQYSPNVGQQHHYDGVSMPVPPMTPPWDKVRPIHYNSATGAMIMYDEELQQPHSLELSNWSDTFQKYDETSTDAAPEWLADRALSAREVINEEMEGEDELDALSLDDKNAATGETFKRPTRSRMAMARSSTVRFGRDSDKSGRGEVLDGEKRKSMFSGKSRQGESSRRSGWFTGDDDSSEERSLRRGRSMLATLSRKFKSMMNGERDSELDGDPKASSSKRLFASATRGRLAGASSVPSEGGGLTRSNTRKSSVQFGDMQGAIQSIPLQPSMPEIWAPSRGEIQAAMSDSESVYDGSPSMMAAARGTEGMAGMNADFWMGGNVTDDNNGQNNDEIQ
uniref:EGF-like domain-containing protein n=1 Tax=Tetraselmis chuii TaxID=63592 RepID=A0A7S1SXZ9_9CHLO|mmetsp:Transcript_35500/g.63335  ORF Transcript_35500/g.63335 Transcript_35500/m.63335 type:complete len:998 (+) Transcript_35500:279-3272(+)